MLALVAGSLGVSASSAAGSGYPDPRPDFSHPEHPHTPLFKRNQDPVPLLVVYGRFDDLPNLTEAETRAKFFPVLTFGTVADYYFETGLGLLIPAVETSGQQDGIVTVDLGPTGDWFTMDTAKRRGAMLRLADRFVDFARYDTNDNGVVEDSELGVITLMSSPDDTYSCGQTRIVYGAGKLDGKEIGLRTADGGSKTNSLTFAHELGHQHWDMYDHYGYGVGGWDLMGPTCAGPNETWQSPNAFHRLHLGRTPNQTVVRDGYVLPSPTFTYALYDYDRGTDDYFLLEARKQEANTYEQNIPDSGLVVWRIDERTIRSDQEHLRGVELVRPDGVRVPGCQDQDLDGKIDEDPPNGVDDDGDGKIDEDSKQQNGCYGGSRTDAWDPADFRTPQRTMTSHWADGTEAKVAVRTIGRDFVGREQAYLDVRGPGILVDGALADGSAPVQTLVAGSTADFDVTVMNTSEATDTFSFGMFVPDGWSSTTKQLTLAAKESATVRITVTVGENAAIGEQSLTLRGQSTTDSTVYTDYSYLPKVERPTSVAYTGDTAADQSDPAQLKALVRDKFTGAPLAGQWVRFDVGDVLARSAQTGSDGVATYDWTPDKPGQYPVTVVAEAANGYTEARSTAGFTVNAEKATLAITSPALYSDQAQPPMTIKVSEEADGSPGDLTRAALRVRMESSTGDTRIFTGTPGADGVATIPVNTPAGVWKATAELTGGYFTGSAAVQETVVYDPDGSASGSAIGRDTTGNSLSLSVSARYSDGDPTGAVGFASNGKTFSSTTMRWIAVAGSTATLEATGRYAGQSATLRAVLHDNGDKPDRLTVTIITPTAGYQSGDVLVTTGNLTVRTT
ncbi:hypothetical protein GCM10022235_72990 [Kribbella ginsengisoli]|uniref:Big-1 domain-containing protein n=1 Tax=Kribbella ginsengisoli TaxID=363865 RepID=A0ABP6YVF1_9ACTN